MTKKEMREYINEMEYLLVCASEQIKLLREQLKQSYEMCERHNKEWSDFCEQIIKRR